MDLVISGILLGGLYGLASLGLALMFGVLKLVNLAHGHFLVLGALLSSILVARLGEDALSAGALLAVVMGVGGYFLQRWLLDSVLRRSPEATIPITFALGVVVTSSLLLSIGSDPRVVNASYSTSSTMLLGYPVRVSLLLALAVSVAASVGLYFLIERTRFGAQVRAAAHDSESAEMTGINVSHHFALVAAIAIAIASLSGTMVGLSFSVDPVSGPGWLVRAFTVVVLGGLGSIPGTFVGAMILGLAEVFGAAIIGPQYRDLVVFGLLVAVLMIRPQGIASLLKVPERWRRKKVDVPVAREGDAA
jgi:branched-chain amino acid transport system permease protein